MINNKTVTAILLAAGSGTRFGADKNKVYVEIFGKPIVEYSLEVFDANKSIDDIIIVVKQGEEQIIQNILSQGNFSKTITIVIGGATRKESVYNALRKTNADITIIHDSARPAIKNEYIDKALEEMQNYKGVSIGVKSKDTIKITDDAGIIKSTTQRKNTWIVQTPQCFYKEELIKAHEKFKFDESITDDCMLLERMRICC